MASFEKKLHLSKYRYKSEKQALKKSFGKKKLRMGKAAKPKSKIAKGNNNPLKKKGNNPLKKKGNKTVLKRPFAKKAASALTKRNLAKLEDMTLQEKVEKAAGEEDPENAAEALSKMMTKQEHSKVWSQHQTFLKTQDKKLQKEHEGFSKKEKGKAVALWFLEKKSPTLQHQSLEMGAQTSHLQREKWVS